MISIQKVWWYIKLFQNLQPNRKKQYVNWLIWFSENNFCCFDMIMLETLSFLTDMRPDTECRKNIRRLRLPEEDFYADRWFCMHESMCLSVYKKSPEAFYNGWSSFRSKKGWKYEKNFWSWKYISRICVDVNNL